MNWLYIKGYNTEDLNYGGSVGNAAYANSEGTHIYGEMILKHTRNNEYFAKPLSKHNDFPLWRATTRGLQ
jgi:hypothetical protein